ncbi:ATP-binding cassette domain-containing protein [Suttonella sp. R2A3]|uniref:amino acid ABC transporter ATP-binding/permease protein n=1 Tax=Suttonella sp. R2A3 TaxID=2908648 RepID=UPI001F478763|nr:ATP-binding cassette domain-containing protein [Suttonella sp. R2A3]UJF24676.1 ATP-binding cassette domain-containing protein [Suttonella sp. R2A3]
MNKRLFDAQGRLSLVGLWRTRRRAWLLAFLIGLSALLASVGLLALSGWFISAAGLAGVVALSTAYTFNYFTPAAIIRFLAIVRTVGRYGERLASHNAALAVLADLRAGLFARLAGSTKPSVLRSEQHMHRLTTDIDTLNEWPLALLLPWLWGVCFIVIWLVVLLWVAPSLLLWTLPPLLLAGVFLPLVGLSLGMVSARRQAEYAEQRRLALLNPLSCLTALLQWGRWQEYANHFRTQDQRHNEELLRAQHWASALQMLQQFALASVFIILLYRGGLLLSTDDLSVAWLLALILAVFGLAEILLPLSAKMQALGNTTAARERLNALLPKAGASEKPQRYMLPTKDLALTLNQLSARQPQALSGPNDISVALHSGEVLIIQGPSGAGKTTLLQVLAGELDRCAGSMFVNNQPYEYYDWTGKIGYLTQYWDVFDLTLAENLRLGHADADDQSLEYVLAQVGLLEWAQAQPQGLNTPLGEYGAAVSGGQARRIALARLLLKPYPLLLLDEPFAGLDPRQRQRVYEQLRSHQRHGLLVIVSHHPLDWGDGVKMINVTP